ncbi:hypothetical protein WA1_45135 [Scytonema hofmannii PCC 7110]|uniref:Uncharacterized protein n=2 Tax=Scytonema hofmannii TaxID=34078 RepID=A0A139WWN1_9CYAN|nr:hypothetical protein WA1_45135 [Scytonema hofmannii PCC 7110]
MVKKLKDQSLESLYKVKYQAEVLEYLLDKSYLTSFLLTAYEKIREIFTNEELILNISFDPEIIGWKKLTLAIHTNLETDEAYDKLKILDNSWWIDASSIVGNDLDIYITFNEI